MLLRPYERRPRYNRDMNQAVVEQLLELNRRFYTEHGRDFSATRGRLQPGVMRVLDSLQGNEHILDLGCGNGGLARTLSRRGHDGSYLGLDFSRTLLEEAGRGTFSFPVRFSQTNLVQFSTGGIQPSSADDWSAITAFAVLHHIPGADLRLKIIQKVHGLLAPGGLFIHSNWQFLSNPRLKARIQPWDTIDLSQQDVDSHDHLLDWNRGEKGLRYVHHFDEVELARLAEAGGFQIVETFYSDGENKKSGLYQVWRKP